MSSSVNLALGELSRLPPQEAMAVLEAIEHKRKQESYIKYWEPMEEQLGGIKALSGDIKTFVIRAGNRAGKTELGAAIVTAAVLGKEYFKDEPAWKWVQYLPFKDPPINVWIVGLDFSAIRDVIWGEKLRYGKSHSPFIPKEAISKISDSEFWWRLPNGSNLICKSADSGWEKFQGASVDIVWFDEESDVTVYDECYQRTVDCDGKILVTLTPLTDISSGVKTPWVFDLYEKMLAGQKDIAFVDLSTMKSKYISDIEKAKLLEKWAGHPEEEARLYGKFLRRSGLVYYMWNPAIHVVPTTPVPRADFKLVVIDPAPNGPTGALAISADKNGNMTVFQEYKEAKLIASEHAKNILVAFSTGQPIDLWLMDPIGGNQKNAETHKTIADLYRAAGVPVRLVPLPEDYGLGASMEYLNASMQPEPRHPKVFIQEHLVKFRHEIGSYVWDSWHRGDLKGKSKEKPKKGNDDLLNSFQYACAFHPRSRRLPNISEIDRRQAIANNSYT